MKSWINIPENSDFSIHNIPFGIALFEGNKIVVSRIGDTIIYLSALHRRGYFDGIDFKEDPF